MFVLTPGAPSADAGVVAIALLEQAGSLVLGPGAAELAERLGADIDLLDLFSAAGATAEAGAAVVVSTHDATLPVDDVVRLAHGRAAPQGGDFSTEPGGFDGTAKGAEKDYGANLASFFVKNAIALGVMYVVWFCNIWHVGTGWRHYNTAGSVCGDNPSPDHTNHVHVSIY